MYFSRKYFDFYIIFPRNYSNNVVALITVGNSYCRSCIAEIGMNLEKLKTVIGLLERYFESKGKTSVFAHRAHFRQIRSRIQMCRSVVPHILSLKFV